MNAQIITPLEGPANIPAGGRQVFELWGTGPASYALAGDPLYFNPTVFLSAIPVFVSQSGNYEILPVPSVTNNTRPTWNLIWTYSGIQGVATVVQNAAGSGMTPGTVVAISFSGGGGSGAAGTVTVLTATTISIAITANGSGYTSAPTASVTGTGGTPPTLTATAAAASGVVAASTVLSGETVQFFAIGGEV
jgi:hypothetical protein